MKKLILCLTILLASTICYADSALTVKGSSAADGTNHWNQWLLPNTRWLMETDKFPTTRGDESPLEEGDMCILVDSKEVYTYINGQWEYKNKNAEIKAIILDTKSILQGTDPNSPTNIVKRLRNAEKIIWLILKEGN